MATATTSNTATHHHHHTSKYDNDDPTGEQKLHRLRISNSSTPLSNVSKRPGSTLNNSISSNTSNSSSHHHHNHHHHHHHHHNHHHNAGLTSPSDQQLNLSDTSCEKTKQTTTTTNGRIMTASSPSLLNRTSNVNKTITSNNNNNNKKLSSLSNDPRQTTKPMLMKTREQTFGVDVLGSPTTAAYSPQTYTIVEGVADTSTSAEPAEQTQQAPQMRLTTRRRVSEADLRSKEQKDKRLKEFDLLNTVGTGTFGRVMVARHQESKEYYALKIMSIVDVVRLKQVDHVRNEKNILEFIKHPFIVKLFWTHHSEQYLYMLLEYVPGGELFSVLRQYNKFEPKMAVFYAAEIVAAFEYLHSFQIVYRDLKPENILLDYEGHLKLTDFGFAKKVTNKTFTLCGTPEYLAPEIIQARGHSSTADWWALGILVYEMLSGSPPFYDESTHKIYERILQGKIEWPRYFDFSAKDIIKRFLTSDPTKRLGSGNTLSNNSSSFIATQLSSASSGSIAAATVTSNDNQTQRSRLNSGADEVKRHRWFVSITNWDDVYNRRIKPPFRPKILHEGDTSNFEKYETPDLQRAQYATIKDLDMFYEF